MKKPFDPIPKPTGLPMSVTAVGVFAEHALSTEKRRVALQVRLAHLAKNTRVDEHTMELLERTWELENFTDDRMKHLVLEHPAAPWFLRIEGWHLQSIAKIVGEVEMFGRWYPLGHAMIPYEVKRDPVKDDAGAQWIWVRGIERLMNASKFDKYAGLTPDSKAVPGELLPFNRQLRTYIFRLGHFGLMMGGGSKNSKYYQAFVEYKENRIAKLTAQGIRIRPTPTGRFCGVCAESKTVPKTTFTCPDCGTKLGKKEEPAGIMWQGHVHAQCFRWLCKLAMHHFWAVWREAEGLSAREPYAMQYLGHQKLILPYEMCDLAEPRLVVLKEPATERKRLKRLAKQATPTPPVPPLEEPPTDEPDAEAELG